MSDPCNDPMTPTTGKPEHPLQLNNSETCPFRVRTSVESQYWGCTYARHAPVCPARKHFLRHMKMGCAIGYHVSVLLVASA